MLGYLILIALVLAPFVGGAIVSGDLSKPVDRKPRREMSLREAIEFDRR